MPSGIFQTDNKIIVISGATASCKSSLALDFACKANGVIINADALQIFKELPILSAQPCWQDLNQVSHKLYSKLSNNQKITVASWLKMIKNELEEARRNNILPIIVGGSGMYISRLIFGINKIPEIPEEVSQNAQNLYNELSREEFVEKLIILEGGNFIKNCDKQRLIRRYEVISHTKKSLDYWLNQPNYNFINSKNIIHINLELEREKLYRNCNKRFLQIFENGAIDEVKLLLQQNINKKSQVTKTLGFEQIKDYLDQKITKDKAIEISQQKTRNYAKRQLTWFRNQFNQDNKITFSDKKKALEFLLKNYTK